MSKQTERDSLNVERETATTTTATEADETATNYDFNNMMVN